MRETADYARTGKAAFEVAGEGGSFALAVQRPGWAESYEIKVNGKAARAKEKNGYICVKRAWKAGDKLEIAFPYEIRSIEKTWEYRNAGKKEYNFSNW